MEFVRVKRRYNEDPFNSIVVSHKKLKTVGADLSKDCVFQFAATIKDEVSTFVNMCCYTCFLYLIKQNIVENTMYAIIIILNVVKYIFLFFFSRMKIYLKY